jgi:hypothetical protein
VPITGRIAAPAIYFVASVLSSGFGAHPEQFGGNNPTEPAREFYALAACGAYVHVHRQAVTTYSRAATHEINASNFSETATSFCFNGHLHLLF